MSDTPDRPSAPEAPAASAPARSHWTLGRVVGMVFASIGGLIGLALLAGGIAVLIAFAAGRDDDGYFSTDTKRLATPGYAITTERIDLGADEVDWAPEGLLGKVRVRVEGDKPVFVGIGTDADVDRYLAGVAHSQLVDFGGDAPELERASGGAPRTPPGQQDFWVAEVQGSGVQTLTWDADFGRWTVVAMNADASRGVDVDASAGVKLDWAIWAGIGATLVGLLMTAGAVAVILLIGRRATAVPGGRDPV